MPQVALNGGQFYPFTISARVRSTGAQLGQRVVPLTDAASDARQSVFPEAESNDNDPSSPRTSCAPGLPAVIVLHVTRDTGPYMTKSPSGRRAATDALSPTAGSLHITHEAEVTA